MLDNGMPAVIQTANGAVRAQRTRIERLRIGPISATDMPAIVAPEFGQTNVLGMNFLSSLKGWRVEGRTLVLEPHGTDQDHVD